MFTSLLNNMVKYVDQYPEEEIHRTMSGRVQTQEVLSLWSWVMCTYSPTWKLSEQSANGILWRLPHIAMINYQFCFSPFSPLQKSWRWGRKFQASSNGLVFLMTSTSSGAIQEATQSHFIKTNDASITQGILRNQESYIRNQAQRPNIRTKDVPSVLNTWNL